MTIPASLPIPSTPPSPLPPLVPQDGDEGSPGISMLQVVSILRAFWPYSVATAVAIMVASAVCIYSMPKEYVATATLLVSHVDRDPLAAAQEPAGGPLEPTYIPTQIELIASREVLRPVIDRLNLTHDRELLGGFSGSPDAQREAVEQNLEKALVVQQDKGSELVTISVSYPHPARAAEISNAIADEFLKQAWQRATEFARERAAYYAHDLQQLHDKMDAAQDRVTEFREQHAMTDMDGGVDLTSADLTDLQQKLVAAQNARRDLETHQVLDSGAVEALRAKLATEAGEMAQLRATLGPRHPQVIALQSEIAATHRSLDQEMQSLAQKAQMELTQARELEAKYQAAVDAQRGQVVAHRDLQDQASKLLIDLQSATATYKRAQEGYDKALFAIGAISPDVSLESHATAPVKATKPNKPKLFIIACLAALGLGLTGPFAYELLIDRRLRCRDDLERNFGMPVLVQFGPIGQPG